MKFWHESSTPWHSKRCRRQTTWITNILKSTAYSPRRGVSFRANLALIRGGAAELRACQKVPTDRQTAFRLYIVEDWTLFSKLLAYVHLEQYFSFYNVLLYYLRLCNICTINQIRYC